nr:MAG TPA: hypothetical protein [Caudoviricetes sp.]
MRVMYTKTVFPISKKERNVYCDKLSFFCSSFLSLIKKRKPLMFPSYINKRREYNNIRIKSIRE